MKTLKKIVAVVLTAIMVLSIFSFSVSALDYEIYTYFGMKKGETQRFASYDTEATFTWISGSKDYTIAKTKSGNIYYYDIKFNSDGVSDIRIKHVDYKKRTFDCIYRFTIANVTRHVTIFSLVNKKYNEDSGWKTTPNGWVDTYDNTSGHILDKTVTSATMVFTQDLIPYRDGYRFCGYLLQNTGVYYYPGDTIPLVSTDNTRLHAIWKLELKEYDNASAKFNQDVTVNFKLPYTYSTYLVRINQKDITCNNGNYSLNLGRLKEDTEVLLQVYNEDKFLDEVRVKVEVPNGFFDQFVAFFVKFFQGKRYATTINW